MDMLKFLNKRKKENRQSLIIDNLNIDSLREQFTQRRNSLSTESTNTYSITDQYITDQSIINQSITDQSIIEQSIIEQSIYKTEPKQSITEQFITEQSIYKIETEKLLETPVHNYEIPNIKYKENEILKKNYDNISRPLKVNIMDKSISSGIQENNYYNSNEYSCVDNTSQSKRQERDDHKCNLCYNKNQIKDSFMILTCGHIFHIRCLVDSHYTDANKCGVIDEDYFNSRICYVCSSQMEMEDILYIHNKFYKNTKEYIVRQDETIEKLDKQMTKLKEELRTCYEYKQKLEHQREKSRQITVTINTMI
jgi:hypothetical protein